MVHLNAGAATDVGLVRPTNQDAHLATPPVFVVADGMGGHEGGEVASAAVVEEFARLARAGFDPSEAVAAVERALHAARARIVAHVQQRRAAGAVDYWSGTTVVAALLAADAEGPKWLLVNLGDSRIYKLHDDRFDQVSVDHSVVQQLIDSGQISAAEAEQHPERHVITRALGPGGDAEPDLFVLPLGSARRLLLCSDGVSGMVDDAEMGRIVREVADPRDAAEQLVARALAAGGEDNATAVIVDVVGWTAPGAADDTRAEPVRLEDKLGALP